MRSEAKHREDSAVERQHCTSAPWDAAGIIQPNNTKIQQNQEKSGLFRDRPKATDAQVSCPAEHVKFHFALGVLLPSTV